MTNRHLRRYSASLSIREMEIKTTMRYHCLPVRMAKIKNINNNVGMYVEKKESSWIIGVNAN